MRTLRAETCLWYYNACDSVITNVQCDPEGETSRPSDVVKSGGSTTPEMYTVADVQSDTAL